MNARKEMDATAGSKAQERPTCVFMMDSQAAWSIVGAALLFHDAAAGIVGLVVPFIQ